MTGTLTILRNAGAPDETREHIPFKLPTEDKELEIPIGSFAL